VTGDTIQRWRNNLTNTNDTAAIAPMLLESAFAKLKIPASLLAEAGVQRVTDAQARTEYGIKASPSQNLDGIIFPYFSVVDSHRTTARLRRDHHEVDGETGKSKNKYLAPFGDPRHLYILPGAAEKLKDLSIPVVLVEAEKSVLAMTAWANRTAANLIPIGLGGCWGWSGRSGIEVSPKGERQETKGPLADLAYCRGRKVYVLLDTNVETNFKVQAARRALITVLREKGASDVLVCNLPPLDGVNGPDDYVAATDDEAMLAVFESAHPPEKDSNRTEAETSKPAARRGYLRMPHAVLQHGPALGPYGLAVALVLADHADVQGMCWPSVKRIMQVSGIGAQATVQKALEKLSELGVIETDKKRQGFITKHVYRFTGWNGEPASTNSSDESAPFHPMKSNKNQLTRTNSARGGKFLSRSPSTSSNQHHQVQSPVNIELPISPRETVNEFIEGEL